MTKTTNYEVKITIRVSHSDRDRLFALAKSQSMNLSKFLRALPDIYPQNKVA